MRRLPINIGCMPSSAIAWFLHSAVDRAARGLPATASEEDPQAGRELDSSWHTSSFELQRGLEVIEHHGALLASSDTLPDPQPAARAAQ